MTKEPEYIEEGDNEGYILRSVVDVAEFYGRPVRTIENWIKRGMPRDSDGKHGFIYCIRFINDWIQEEYIPRMKVDYGAKLHFSYFCEWHAACDLRSAFIIHLPKLIAENGKGSIKIAVLLDMLNELTRWYERKSNETFVKCFKELTDKQTD
jgi:hypothetical protein